jgi:ABC-type transporter Mla subunit MlaD
MLDHWKQQFEFANRMIKMMENEHNERLKNFDLFMETSRSLIQKLADRDAEIDALRAEINALRDQVNSAAGK